jgi:hypothetical protein
VSRNKVYKVGSPWKASNAANGNTSGIVENGPAGNCIVTPDNWEVDLGASYTIYNLKVWGGNNRMYILM